MPSGIILPTTTSVDIDGYSIDPDTMIHESGPTQDKKTGEVTSTYVLPTLSITHPARASYRVQPQVRAGEEILRLDVRLSSYVAKEDADGNTIWKEISGSVSLNIPTTMDTVSVAETNQFLATLYALAYLQVTTGDRNTDVINTLLLGSPAVV